MTEVAEKNPLLQGLGARRTPSPCALVVFGASGDLTRRKIFPALYSLACRRLLPEQFAVVGVARRDWTDDEFRERMEHAVREFGRDDFDEDVWEWLGSATRYLSLDFADEAGEDRLAALLTELDEERGTRGNRVYYLAIPPKAMATVVEAVGKRRSAEGWTRLIIEKPFGHDLASRAGSHRADQPLLHRAKRSSASTTTSARRPFRTCWRCGSRTASSSRSGTASSSTTSRSPSPRPSGVEGRAGYYEQAGAIRDIFQNHMLQLVALTAMEPPIDFTAESVRNEKVKVLKAIHTPGPKHIVRGQYGPGYIDGKEVPGYRQEEGRRSRLDDRDLCRREALRGQLALGGHAVLRPYRANAWPGARRRSRSSSSGPRTRRSRTQRPRS